MILKLPFITIGAEIKVKIRRRGKYIPDEEILAKVSTRTANCLMRRRWELSGSLRYMAKAPICELSDNDLMCIRCFGVASLREVRQAMGR